MSGEARREYLKLWKRRNKAKMSVQNALYRQKLKRKVIDAYGASCACCSERTIGFLTIDHVNNDGKEHRKKVFAARLYNWLQQNGFPSGFQVLCFNCNLGKAHNKGVCPHKVLHVAAI